MNLKHFDKIKDILDKNEIIYNNVSFIENDPISIPHSFKDKHDIEIMGFFASVFAWGQRVTIINKCKELAERMDNSPYQFITQHEETDLKKLLKFKHRTFNDLDLLYFIDFLKTHYSKHNSLEDAFIYNEDIEINVKNALTHFYNYFFLNEPDLKFRTRKHISTPAKKSACKRINMYLRWMVRHDNNGVDFGIWKKIKAKNLICPLDVHVNRAAQKLGLLERESADWQAAEELTSNLRYFCEDDPVKYDFALFGLSIDKQI